MPQIKKLAEGVEGLFIKNDRFKTTLVSFHFYLPLSRETYSANALLPYVLSSCSEDYKTFRELNLALGNLYGATITAGTNKIMDYQWTSLSINVINDRYSINGESTVNKAAELLASLLFKPAIENGEFYNHDVLREKTQLLDLIKGEINNKRSYAISKTQALMFADDPYGISKYGEYEDMEKIDGKDLFAAWERLLRDAYIRVNVVGESLPEGLMEAVGAAFSAIRRDNVTEFSGFHTPQFAENIDVTERMDIAQGKLVLGFSMGEVTEESRSGAKTVMADIFGGGPYSRLFTNVREKQSLCYYCAARAVKNKGYMICDSGVESENVEKAQREILNQLKVMQNGEFTDEEFEASVCSICDSVKSASDSAAGLDVWYAARVFDSSVPDLDAFYNQIKAVTKEEVTAAAQQVKLCAVYKLLPQEK